MAPLAQHIPALWQAPTTTMAERTAMVRQIMQRVMVAGAGKSARLQMTIEWVGGGRPAGLTTRPIRHIAHVSDYPRVCARIRTLVHEGYSTVQITALLAHEGFRSPKHVRPFSRQAVIELMRRLGVPQPRRRRRPPVPEHEWWWSDLERELGRSHSTLQQWRTRGWLQARWHDHSQRWVAWADEAERQRLKQHGTLATGEASRHMWLDAQRSQPTGSLHFTAVSSQQRRYVLQHDQDKKCLEDSMMVDPSSAVSRGRRAFVGWPGITSGCRKHWQAFICWYVPSSCSRASSR
jgi:hypothetical protein